MGGSGALPHSFRSDYADGQRAALSAIAREIKQSGACDWPVEKIADAAGVSVRTVQYACSTAAKLGHLEIEIRPNVGAKNETNVYTIRSKEWMEWLSGQCRVDFWPELLQP